MALLVQQLLDGRISVAKAAASSCDCSQQHLHSLGICKEICCFATACVLPFNKTCTFVLESVRVGDLDPFSTVPVHAGACSFGRFEFVIFATCNFHFCSSSWRRSDKRQEALPAAALTPAGGCCGCPTSPSMHRALGRRFRRCGAAVI